jgi:hypothetical protein
LGLAQNYGRVYLALFVTFVIAGLLYRNPTEPRDMARQHGHRERG